jgi:hypothetical protein
VYRDGAHRQAMFRREGIPGTWSDTNKNCSEVGCDWPVSVILSETEGWRSGGFVIKAFVPSNDGGVVAESEHVVIIGPGHQARTTEINGRLLLVAATASVQRPYARGFVARSRTRSLAAAMPLNNDAARRTGMNVFSTPNLPKPWFG